MGTFSNGKIYKIYSKIGNVTYYGSTIQTLKKRIYKHIENYKNDGCYTSKLVLCYPDYKFDLVEYYPCNSKKELLKREGYYQKNFECVNKQIAGRTKKEWYQDNINYNKNYYQNNIDIIKQRRNEKFNCSCGGKYTRTGKSQHKKTKKHIKYIESLNITI